MTASESPTSNTSIRFPSLEALRVAHNKLLKQSRKAGEIANIRNAAEVFIQRGKATGALLDGDADRWAAQSVLDYWATKLYQPGYEPPDATLDEFDAQLAPELDDSLSPYVGLDAFHEADQSVFFGREHFVRELLRKLKTVHFLTVLGSSGSGKSSVVRAGLIPALKKGALPDSENWIYLSPMVPGSNPLSNLARLMLPDMDTSQIASEVNHFYQDTTYLSYIVSRRFNNNVLLLVDQFEEIFTLCTDEITRQRFVDNLIGLCKTPTNAHRVILTMRTDFETSITRLSGLHEIFKKGVVRVTPLTASELREAIELPAALIGLKFEEGLVDTLLNDTLGEPAALPLLQFTLLKLWENRERNRVTWESYKRLGGGRQALAHSADEFYNRLIPEEQATMRRILLKMVRLGEGLEVTSNRVPRVALYERAEASDRIDRVLEKLINARLIRVSEGDIASDEQVEVAHEALVRNWPRLVEWLEHERVVLRQRQQLANSAEEWLRLGREPSALWRGILLAEARRYDDLSVLEREFVAASHAAEQDEVERKLNEERQQKELEYVQKLAEAEKLRAVAQAQAAIRLRRGRVYLTGALIFAILLGITALVFALQSKQIANANAILASQNAEIAKTAEAAYVLANAQQSIAQENAEEAQNQAEIARAGELAGQALSEKDNQLDLALLLSIEGFRTRVTPRTESALLTLTNSNPQLAAFLSMHRSRIDSLAYDPNNKILASGSSDSAIILWDVSNPKTPIRLSILSGHNGWVWSVAFSPDGKTLASGSEDTTIILWDISDPKHPIKLSTISARSTQVASVAFDLDGTILASGYHSNSIILWDVSDPKSPVQLSVLSGHGGPVASVSFSPDGNTLASGSHDNTIILWDVSNPQSPIKLPTLEAHSDFVRTVAFSPNGRVLASGSWDNTIILWDVSNPQSPIQLSTLTGHNGWVYSVAFSPDGKILASGSEDKTIILWDVSNPQSPIELDTLLGHSDQVISVVFISQDGNILASGSEDTKIILWDVDNANFPTKLSTLLGHQDLVWTVAFSPNGRVLASGSWDNTIILWDVSNPSNPIRLSILSGHSDTVRSVAFSPDSRILASGGGDKTIILWDVSNPQSPIRLSILVGHNATIRSVAFSPDGKTLASGSEDKTIILWDVSKPQTPIELDTLLGHSDNVTSVTISSDSKLLASGSDDSSFIVWEIGSPKQPTKLSTLSGYQLWGSSLAFNSDSKVLASGGEDSTIILWNISNPKTLTKLSILSEHSGPVWSITFSPEYDMLASGSEDKTIILWDVSNPQSPIRLSTLLGHSEPIRSVAFQPDSKLLASGSNDFTVILWNLDPQSWIDNSCQRVGRNLTRAEWAQYVTYRPYPENRSDATCPQWPLKP